jgi:hypothetical protein
LKRFLTWKNVGDSSGLKTSPLEVWKFHPDDAVDDDASPALFASWCM